MSITIGSVPKNITRRRYVELLESVGFKANEVKAVEFAADGVYVTAFAMTEDGQKIIDPSPGSTGFAKHRLFVPVVENDHARETTSGAQETTLVPLSPEEAAERSRLIASTDLAPRGQA